MSAQVLSHCLTKKKKKNEELVANQAKHIILRLWDRIMYCQCFMSAQVPSHCLKKEKRKKKGIGRKSSKTHYLKAVNLPLLAIFN